MKSEVPVTTRCAALATGAALVLSLFLFAAAAPAGASAEPITISVLSGRADLVSAGDALVRIGGVSSTQGLKVTVGGTNRTSAFAKRADGTVVGLVRGLKRGRSAIIARAGDRAAQLTVTNHPKGGPIFSGPQLQAVEVPGDRDGRAVQRAAEVHLPLQVDRPGQAGLPALRPGQPACGRRDHDDRQGRDGAVHRARRDRLPRPRPVPDRRAVPARQAVDGRGAAAAVQPQAADPPRRLVRRRPPDGHARRRSPTARPSRRSGSGSRRCRTRSTTPGTTATSRPRPSR